MGACLAGGLQLARTFRSTQFRDATVAEHADVVVEPDFEIASTSDADGITIQARYVDGETWADLGSGWINGDAASIDPEQVMVAQAGSVALAMSSPEAFAPARLLHAPPGTLPPSVRLSRPRAARSEMPSPSNATER